MLHVCKFLASESQTRTYWEHNTLELWLSVWKDFCRCVLYLFHIYRLVCRVDSRSMTCKEISPCRKQYRRAFSHCLIDQVLCMCWKCVLLHASQGLGNFVQCYSIAISCWFGSFLHWHGNIISSAFMSKYVDQYRNAYYRVHSQALELTHMA